MDWILLAALSSVATALFVLFGGRAHDARVPTLHRTTSEVPVSPERPDPGARP